jgi:outer membrane receptor for ferrienterochelin and colicins
MLLLGAVVGALTEPRWLEAQTPTGTVVVHVTAEGTLVAGATVASGTIRAVTDRSGAVSLTLLVGARILNVTRIGFAPESLQLTVRAGTNEVSVTLHGAALPEVVIAATRNERRVSDEPTRVEVTGRDDVEEQIGGSPGIIAELLTESGGVRVQRTSAGSSGSSVRIRGMRGRYTKILSDGLPLFGVTTEGLGPLQIPPIDLQRVEVIKGVASALYGPTALGGVVNLVSELPTSQREIVVNQTSRRGSDVVLWQTHTLNPQWGYTLVAGGHYQHLEDGDGDGWADLNGYRRAVVRPRLFWTGSQGNSWFVTSGFTSESRTGGTVSGGRLPNGQPYRDDANTRRADVGTVARFVLDSNALVSVRASTTEEWRTRWYGTVRERDRRNALFGEMALTVSRGSQVLVAGAAMERDAYTGLDVRVHDYTYAAPGLFAEHTWSPVTWFGVSSSARADFHNEYGTFLSPRISMLFRAGPSWNARLSAGSGVFAPTPFTEETEAIGLTHLRPAPRSAERATGASVDVGGTIGPLELHASTHRSVVNHPLALRAVAGSATDVELVNAPDATRTGGAEVYARYRIDPVHFTGTYTYIDASELDIDRGLRRTVPLNARHAFGLSGVYEEEHDAIVGLELYYTGRQAIADDPYRSVSRPYATVDALIQKQLGRLIVFLHGEDLNGVRQTQFDPILRPAPARGERWTTDVWAPLEGRVINAGLRVQY